MKEGHGQMRNLIEYKNGKRNKTKKKYVQSITRQVVVLLGAASCIICNKLLLLLLFIRCIYTSVCMLINYVCFCRFGFKLVNF